MHEKKAGSQVNGQPQTPKRSRSRAALFAGFGALLILMAIICIDSLHTLESFETRNTQIRQDFLYRERTLDELRARLYESRDTLLDYVLIKSEPQQQEALRAELHAIQYETKEKLQQCIQSLPTAKRQPFERLNVELTKYWSTIESSVEPHREKGKEPGNLVSRSDALSQHAAVLAIAKQVSALNDAELKEAARAITQAFAQFRRRMVIVVTVALSFALILATATIVYAGRLEKNVEQKYRESLQAQRELKELSKRLVDAEERERRAISRELHDEVGQSLSALLLEVENLAEMSSEGGLFRRGLQNIKTLAENGVNEVRNMALLLRPSMLDDLGLVAALEWQAREVSRRTGMLVETVDENVSETLPDEHKTCVYRIVQEALNNCSRHAYAKNVRVVVRQEPNQLRVSIEDDGKGFDSRRVRGLGLVGMNERVSQLGGVLTVDSDPTRGTRLRVELPLPNSSTDLEKLSR